MSQLSRRNFLNQSVTLAAGIAIRNDTIDARVQRESQVISPIQARAPAAQGKSYSPTDFTRSDDVLEQLAYAFDVRVPRTQSDGSKWGWELQILEVSPDSPLHARRGRATYMVSVINEVRDDGVYDPRRMLTTALTLGNQPEVSLEVNPALTHYEMNPNADNAMTLAIRNRSGLGVNNLIPGHFLARPQVTSTDAFGDLGVRLDQITEQPDETTYLQDVSFYHRHLRGNSDPYSITTWRQVGNGNNGHGTSQARVYKVEPDGKRGLVLTADIVHTLTEGKQFSANGLMQRDDSQSDVGGTFAELALVTLNRHLDGYTGDKPDRESNRYKIGNQLEDWARATTFHRPHLDRWVEIYHATPEHMIAIRNWPNIVRNPAGLTR